jgi:hypothetical protein
MATFRKQGGQKILRYLKKNPTLVTSSAALAIGTANLATNTSRRKEAEEQNKKQVKAMNKLADSLSKVSASFDEADKRGAVIVKEKEQQPTKRKFRIGYYSSFVDDVWGGTMKGLGVGGLINGIALGAAAIEKKGWTVNQAFKAVGYSVLVGAALGLVLGVTKKIAETSSRNKTNQRVINTVIKLLKNKGFEENKDFTTDPKTADLEKTKVTVLVNRGNGDLKLALNVISDEKLEKVCNKIVSELPDKSKTMTKESNRYNEIMITTLSSGNDAIVISGIIEKFIRAGYPVYMIEVG